MNFFNYTMECSNERSTSIIHCVVLASSTDKAHEMARDQADRICEGFYPGHKSPWGQHRCQRTFILNAHKIDEKFKPFVDQLDIFLVEADCKLADELDDIQANLLDKLNTR